MKGIFVFSILGLLLIAGCIQEPIREFPAGQDGTFCDASTPCPEGYECYKFPDENTPVCWDSEFDPCSRCSSGECMIAESYPMQVFCIDELYGEPPCDENNQCEIGECYKFDDRDYPICWEGDPCSRCTMGECNLIGSNPPVVECINEGMPSDEFCGWSTAGVCSGNSDCMTGGCSGQVCQSKNEEPVATTCEYVDCYDAESYGLSCGCVNGRCEWNRNCTSYEVSECPEGCRVCPPCPECSSLMCFDEWICEGLGFDENWSETVTEQ